MLDILSAVLILALFALAHLYTEACDRLKLLKAKLTHD